MRLLDIQSWVWVWEKQGGGDREILTSGLSAWLLWKRGVTDSVATEPGDCVLRVVLGAALQCPGARSHLGVRELLSHTK